MATHVIEDQEQAPSRPWGWWLAGAASLVVLAGVPLGYVGAKRSTTGHHDEAERILAELGADGLGATPADLYPDGPSPGPVLDRMQTVLNGAQNMPAEQKAALVLYRFEVFTPTGRKDFLGVPEEEALVKDPKAWRTETAAALASLSKIVPSLDQVLAEGELRFDLQWSEGASLMLPHLMPLKELTQQLCGRAMQRQSTGDAQGAWADLERALRLAKAWREPILISYLVRSAMVGISVDTLQRLIRNGPAPDALQGRVIDGLLQELDATAGPTRAFRGELALILAALPADGSVDPGLEQEVSGVAHKLPLVGSWKWSSDRHAYVEVMAEAIRATRRKPLEARHELERLVEATANSGKLVGLILPALDKSFGKSLTVQAQLRMARMAMALAQAPSLPNLPNVPPLSLTDPTAGNAPVRWLREGPRGGRLWCSGEDGRDDGGKNPDAKNQLQPDIVFQVTLPAPPAPKPKALKAPKRR